MTLYNFNNPVFLKLTKICFILCWTLSACTIPRKYQKNKPFLSKNTIEVKGGNFTRDERNILKQRLNGQLDDSSRIVTKDAFFFLHFIDKPPAYDSSSSSASTKNMKASMLHLGYYGSAANFKADTTKDGKKEKVHVTYTVNTGKPTLIETVGYFLRDSTLQKITTDHLDKTLLKKNKPVTKSEVLGEVNRLVELYRNNGYYKFTTDELKVRGDTSIAALTTISDDPFEQLQLLAEAQAKRDSPAIKMAIVLNPPNDKSRLKQYYINNVYILPDYAPGDSLNNPTLTEINTQQFIIRYHHKLFKNNFLTQPILLKKGDLYNQQSYFTSLNNYAKLGVWRNTNIQIVEVKDSFNKIDLVVQLIPAFKLSFEAGIEASYSANSNTNNITTVNAGNLLGLSGNISLTNRNWLKQGIKLSGSLRAGMELNINTRRNVSGSFVNSNEITPAINIIFPKLIVPKSLLRYLQENKSGKLINAETFINVNGSVINRINLFNLQSVNLGMGWAWSNAKQRKWVVKPVSIEFARLYNETDSFRRTLERNPFLRYSFNTSLVAGMSVSYSSAKINPRKTNRQHTLKINLEESGYGLFGLINKLGLFEKYLRKFVKADIEYVHSISLPKSAVVFRLFGGIGVSAKKDTTLPFFKQYFAGGANSMRGWPVRGIGRGKQPLTPYEENTFNDRTGDIQLEANMEYRFDIAQIIPNTLILKGVLFADAGNIWNARNSKTDGSPDDAQFKLQNLYKELGLAAGTGIRLDFNYVVLRFDLGFRFKRPELSSINDGWKAPSIGFDDAFGKLFKNEFKQWRYENMNFTIGISYPF